jgi:hypothetical protein
VALPRVRGAIAALVTRDEVRDVVLVTLVVRGGLMAFAAVAVAVLGDGSLGSRDFLSIWNSWDAPHYLGIAEYGYGPQRDPAEIAFFPLVPLLIRAGSTFLPPLVAGMLISLIATLAAGIGLHRLVLLDADRRAAVGAVVALNVFPTSFALVPPYSEPVFLALAVWSVLLARRGAWPGAGGLGGLAAAARLQGLLLVPTLAVELLADRHRPGRSFLWLALVPVGFVAYLGVNTVAFGDPFAFVTIQREHFYHSPAPPWEAIGSMVEGLLAGPTGSDWITVYFAPLVALALLAGLSLWTLVSRYSRPSYATYTILTFAGLALLTWPISVPRYLLGVFPLFIALGRLAHRPVAGGIALAASIVLLGFFTVLFVQGAWAF